jgi:hypothetical protein
LSVVREETVAAFVEAYRSIGYEPCEHGGHELGLEKVAIFSLDDRPTHVARQLPNGRWSSKLGGEEDIEHEWGALDSPIYGSVVKILCRSGRLI